MSPNDFVYKQILEGAMKKGARESHARNSAEEGVAAYKENRFEKATDLIARKIKKALDDSKREFEQAIPLGGE